MNTPQFFAHFCAPLDRDAKRAIVRRVVAHNLASANAAGTGWKAAKRAARMAEASAAEIYALRARVAARIRDGFTLLPNKRCLLTTRISPHALPLARSSEF